MFISNWRILAWAIYVAFYPITRFVLGVLVFSVVIVKLKSWPILFTTLNLVLSFIASFKFNFVATTGVLIACMLVINASSPFPIAIVKKNPGSSAARSMAADGAGALAFPTDMEDGNYDYTLTIPAMAITEVTGKKTASAATINMVPIKSGDSITLRPSRELKHAINTKGTGSVRLNPNSGTGAVDAPLTPSKP
jgi:hypothetical protein